MVACRKVPYEPAEVAGMLISTRENSMVKIRSFFLMILALAACSAPKEAVIKEEVIINQYAAPVLIPGTSSEMNSAGYWIGIHADPDRIVIPQEKIADFNRSIRKDTKMVQDLTAYQLGMKGSRLSGLLKSSFKDISASKYVLADGSKAQAPFFRAIEKQMNIPAIPLSVTVRFGFVTAYTSQRLLPTDIGLFENRKSLEIDRLQNSSLDIGTPLAILHATRDGKWVFVVSPLSEGWIMAEHMGFCTRDDLAGYLGSTPFYVTIGAKTDVFLDNAMRDHHSYIHMGSRFPVAQLKEQPVNPGAVGILLPFRDADGVCESVSYTHLTLPTKRIV